jgi:hypothetical protein
MPSAAADWIDDLWPAVCARARRPVTGVLLDPGAAAEVAAGLFGGFLDAFPRPPAAREVVQHWLTTRAAPHALERAALERRRLADWNACRDPRRLAWERNPDFDDLRHRTADGALTSREWSAAEPILWRRAAPVLSRLGLGDEDARDVFMECLAELTQARTDPGPLDAMHVFEELPRFFATMVERRGISWLRRQSAQKRRPVNPAFTERLDEPESPIARTLSDPRSDAAANPLARASFDRIRLACGPALTDFEWHLVNALFVEGTHSRLDLAGDPWVLENMGIPPSASESKRRRRLNLFIEEALSKLGRELEICDL